MTMSHPKGKERLMEGFRIGETRIHAREINNDELVVSFMNLPYYIEDKEILEKLNGWGVTAVTAIRRRMWPGTQVADGTRFLKVRFNDQIQSLPYSAKFDTALGVEYFRVIHDKQTKVCRMCMQPGHILRECPEFQCHRCGVQGHYARECGSKMVRTKEKNGIKDGKDETMELEGMEGDVEEEERDGEAGSEDSDDSDGEHEAAEETEMTAEMMTSAAETEGAAVMKTAAETETTVMTGTETAEGTGTETAAMTGTAVRTETAARTETETVQMMGTETAARAVTAAAETADGVNGGRKAHIKKKEVDESQKTNDSDMDMDLVTKIMQIRKRQNPQRYQRQNKKSKNKTNKHQ